MLDDAQRFPDDLKTFIVLSGLSYTIWYFWDIAASV